MRLTIRIAELRSETAEIVAESREIVRWSQEIIAHVQAAADREVGPIL